MVRCLVTIDRSSIRRYASWYQKATEHIRSLYGYDGDFFSRILSATSPRVAVKRNWALAAKAYGQWISRRCLYDVRGFCPNHIPNVQRVFQGLPLHGDKVSRFAENLSGNLEVVTIDAWIAKAYGISHRALTHGQYLDLEKTMQAEARQCGLQPAEYQAVVWHVVRQWYGRKDKSFSSVSRKNSQFLFAFCW